MSKLELVFYFLGHDTTT